MVPLARLNLSANRLFTFSLAFMFVVVVANKRETGGLNCSRAITLGMPAGRGRKGERPPKSRRGKKSTSVVVPRNPSSSVVASQSQKYPNGAQLHNLYPAPGQPSDAAHQIQLAPLYPVSPPCHPYASTFQGHPLNVPSQASSPPFSSAAAGTWHSGLSPNPYYLVALPKNVKKCYGCGGMFAKKIRQPPHNIVVKHVDRRLVRRDGNTGALVYSPDFTNTYYHPIPSHIRRKNPVFDGRVLIDSGTNQSLDEGQREILEKHGLIVNIDDSR